MISLKILDDNKPAEGQKQPAQVSTTSNSIIGLSVFAEKCPMCLNEFGRVIDGVMVEKSPDVTATKKLAEKYSLLEESSVCKTCVSSEDGYDSMGWIFDNAHTMNQEELFAYVAQKGVALQLIHNERGLKLLLETKDQYGEIVIETLLRNDELSGSHDIAIELMKIPGWMEKLAKTKDRYGTSMLYVLAISSEIAALELVSSSDSLELAIKTRRHDGSSVLHGAMMSLNAALKMVETETGRNILARTLDKRGRSSLDVVINFHEEVTMGLAKTEAGIRLMAQTSYDNWSVLQTATRSHTDIALTLAKTKFGAEALFKPTNINGLINPFYELEQYTKDSVVSILSESKWGRRILLDAMRNKWISYASMRWFLRTDVQ